MGLRSQLAQQTRAAAVAATAGLATALVASCGSSNTVTATPTGGAGPYAPPPNASPPVSAGATGRIGQDCAMIPAKGRGSISQLSTEHAITVVSRNPQLSVFLAAVRTAGLDKTLNARRSYTLMVPVNSAFAGLSRTQVTHLHNAGELVKIVRYNAVTARVSPQEFASGAKPATLQGQHLTLSKSGPFYKVNNATVLCGNIRTANATVYIVSKVLLPPG